MEEGQQPKRERGSTAGLSTVMLQVSTQAPTGQRACVQDLTDSLKTSTEGRGRCKVP